jgi:hypothetical protein
MIMRKILGPIILASAIFISFAQCKSKKTAEEEQDPGPATVGAIDSTTNVTGYGILSKLPGIWNGPVTSTTALGSYPEWIVDFRPVSASQVSSKSELDSVNNVLMGFFIVQHSGSYKMAFRNGGGFAGMQRIAYAVIDSVSELSNHYFYRFSDFRAGRSRVYSEVLFKDDSLLMKVYTNVYNTLATPQIHMNWKAKLQDASSTQNAITQFNFPKKTMVKDFSSTFDSKPEAIYYNNSGDPYDAPSQPYLGKTTVNISFGAGYTPNTTKKVFLILTTQSLFNGVMFNPAQLKYRSRYVILSSTDNAYTFDYMHPGTYYLYSLYDSNGDGTFSTGDWMSSNLSNTFNLSALGTQTVNTTIDFTIP